VIRTGRGRARIISEETAYPVGPPRTSRERPPVQEIPGHLTRWSQRSRTCHEAVARWGLRYGGRPDRYPTTRRGRPGPGKYRDVHPTRSARDGIGGGRMQRAEAFERAGDTRISAKRFVQRPVV
jgi:hypothetical protein